MRLDLIGSTFERLTVVEFAGKNKHGKNTWQCKCSCGNMTTTSSTNLLRGITRSCGCLQREVASKMKINHGLCAGGNTSHPLHMTWCNMLQRCMNPDHPSYINYGGRGIYVCEEWTGESGFLRFVKDMGDKPSSQHSLDRINNDGPYSQINCRWATTKQQSVNKRLQRNNKSGYRGVTWFDRTGKWAAAITVDGLKIHLGYFQELNEAIAARILAEERYKTL